MNCRKGCGVCCIEISISSHIPGMPNGKMPGIRCINLSDDNNCRIHNALGYPEVCRNLKPSREMCGTNRADALAYLIELERITKP